MGYRRRMRLRTWMRSPYFVWAVLSAFAFLALSLVTSGCGCVHRLQQTNAQVPSFRSSNVVCIVVGMETSARFGECPGCQRDTDRVSSLLSLTYGYPVTLLQSAAATKHRVTSELRDAVADLGSDGLLVFYYSGHGGSEDFGPARQTEEPEGADAADEYLCLYDTYLLDDEFWAIVSKARCRVFCCFDACHSATMFRSIRPEVLVARSGTPLGTVQSVQSVQNAQNVHSSGGFSLKVRGVSQASGGLRMLAWGGCREQELSIGSASGGLLTSSILSNWRNDRTYDEVWGLARQAVIRTWPDQHPVSTVYGGGFDTGVFR